MAKYIPLYDTAYTEIGILRRAHGYKGHAKLQVEEIYVDILMDQEYLFIEVDGYKVPFKIESLDIKRDIIIKLKGLSTSEDLNRYHMSSIHLLSKDIPISEIQNKDSDGFGLGMEVIDINNDLSIGKIIRIDEYPQQSMAILIINDREVLIPLHENLISEIRTEQNQLLMDLPEGLI